MSVTYYLLNLASQKKSQSQKNRLRFQITKCKIAGFTAEIAEKSPENHRKNRRKIAATLWCAEENRSVSAFSESQRFRDAKLLNCPNK